MDELGGKSIVAEVLIFYARHGRFNRRRHAGAKGRCMRLHLLGWKLSERWCFLPKRRRNDATHCVATVNALYGSCSRPTVVLLSCSIERSNFILTSSPNQLMEPHDDPH